MLYFHFTHVKPNNWKKEYIKDVGAKEKIFIYNIVFGLWWYGVISILKSQLKMPKLIVKIQVYDEIIFVDKLFNHPIIHVHKDTERKGKKPRWIFQTQMHL